jgi:hypothetical protein
VQGVLYLHSFHYPQAVRAFRRARALDPRDAMSAAFEALAHTHPVWNQQDPAAARAALGALAPTRAARLAMARTPRERRWLDAVEALYDGDAPKAVRDTAFARAMERLRADDPRDPEAAAFHALALLGLNQGDREPRAYAQAEAIVDTVLRAHPRHPGALHYKIHAVDDPASAARGLGAARLYGEVASSAGHALHMTSHIYVARGMWDDVVAANRRAAATSPGVFGHGTHWLVYGLLQQGRTHEARAWVDSMLGYARAVAGGAPAARGVSDARAHAVLTAATWVVDADAWDAAAGARAPGHDGAPQRRGAHDGRLRRGLRGGAARRAPGGRRAGEPRRRPAARRLAARAHGGAPRGRARGRRACLGRRRGRGDGGDPARRARGGRRAPRLGRRAAGARRRRAGRRCRSPFGPPGVVKPPRERAAQLLLFAPRPAGRRAGADRQRRADDAGRVQARSSARAPSTRSAGATRRAGPTPRSTAPGTPPSRPSRSLPRQRGAAAACRRWCATRASRPTRSPTRAASWRLRGARWRPAAPGRHPGLAVLHGSGGCWRASEVEALGRLFAARGYVAFFPCRRGLGLSRGQGEAVMDQLRREGVLERDSATPGARPSCS